MAWLEIAPMPQLHWLTWRGELQESPAGFGLAHRTRNAHMVRELTVRFQLSRAVGSISCGWLLDLATTKPCIGICTQDPNGLWTLRLQTCDPIMSWYSAMSFTWRRNSSFPSGRWSFFYYATDQLSRLQAVGPKLIRAVSCTTYIDLKWGEKSMERMKTGVFFQKMQKGSERTLLFFRLPSWDPRWREAQDFAWGSWACNTSCIWFERVWSAKMKVMEMSGKWCWSYCKFCWHVIVGCLARMMPSTPKWMSCHDVRGWGLHVANLQLQTGCSNYHRFLANSWWHRRAPWIPILSCSYSCYLGYLLLGVLFETFEEVQLRIYSD